MFTLQEILDNLTHGDLSHVSIGGAELGFIADKNYPKIVNCINNALTALTLLIAESNPTEKEIMVDLIMNFLNCEV